MTYSDQRMSYCLYFSAVPVGGSVALKQHGDVSFHHFVIRGSGATSGGQGCWMERFLGREKEPALRSSSREDLWNLIFLFNFTVTIPMGIPQKWVNDMMQIIFDRFNWRHKQQQGRAGTFSVDSSSGPRIFNSNESKSKVRLWTSWPLRDHKD